MILFHFTALEYLEAILRDGLTKGDVPISPAEGVSAVWLTVDGNPSGHGLSDGGLLSDAERAAFRRINGVDVPLGAHFANKRAVRISVKIPSNDRALVHWPKWARKRVAPEWYATLSRTGGQKQKTWYLYFGVIKPTTFLAIENPITGVQLALRQVT